MAFLADRGRLSCIHHRCLRASPAHPLDQIKRGLREAAGKVQEKAGELVGSKSQQAKGLTKEVEGKAQKGVGDAKEALKDAGRSAE